MRRISILGLVAVCAMALAAVMASAAAATPTTVETGNTAFTCVNSGTNEGANKFTDKDCVTVNNASGTFWHKKIAENESTELKLTKETNPTLKSKVGLATVTLTATGVNCVSCVAKNQTAAGTMDVTGSGGKIEFTGVTVSTTNCAAEGLPEGGGAGTLGTVTTHKLKLTTLSPTKASLEPETGTVVAEFNFVNSGGTCPLTPNNPIKVEGHADGTLAGAIVTFETVAGMLSIGSQTFTLTSRATMSGRANSAEGFKPVSLTAA